MKIAVTLLLLTACSGDAFISMIPSSDADAEAASDKSDSADATPDSNPLTDGGPCTPPSMWTYKCPDQTIAVAPTSYCTNWAGRLTTPAACTTCKENYSCGCLEGHGATYCPPDGGTWHCDDKNGQLVVSCQ